MRVQELLLGICSVIASFFLKAFPNLNEGVSNGLYMIRYITLSGNIMFASIKCYCTYVGR